MKDFFETYDRVMEAERKYCNRCARKPYCHTPCALVLAAVMELPCVEELERMNRQHDD